jgi:hypothetical protein
MSNKHNDLLKMVDHAYVAMVCLAAYELGELTTIPGLTCPTDISYEKVGDEVAIIATKSKKKAKKRDDRWPIAIVKAKETSGTINVVSVSSTSLLTLAEAEEMILKEQSSMPVQQAVRVLARGIGPDVSMAFEKFYAGEGIADLITEEEVLEIMTHDSSKVARLLRALPSALDDYNTNHLTDRSPLRYDNVKEKTPIRAEKIVRALRLVVTIAARERESLLMTLSPEKLIMPCLRGALQDSELDYEAADKIAGKACFAGVSTPSLLLKAKTIYHSTIHHKTFIKD